MPGALAILCLLFGLILLAGSVSAQTRNWTGAVSANWSDPNNWSPVGVPTNGERIAFGYASDSHHAMVNDMTNLKLYSMEFVDKSYQLDGNALEIDGNVSDLDDATTDSHTTTINCPLIIGGSGVSIGVSDVYGHLSESTIYLHLNGPITLNGNLSVSAEATPFEGGGNGHIYVSGVISGTGDVSAYAQEYDGHTSTVEFDGTPGNSFTGTLYVSTIGNGQIVFNKSSGVVVVNRIGVRPTDIYNLPQTANLNIVAQNQIDPNATLMVYDGCQLHLMGLNSTVGYLVLTNFSENTNASVIDTGGTTLGLNDGIVAWNDSASVIPAVKGTLNLNGPLSFNIGGSQYAGLELPSKMGSAGGFTKTGPAALLLETNNTFSGNVTVSQGIVDVRNSNALGDTSGSTSLTGGSLTLRNVSVAGETLTSVVADSLLFSIGTCTWSGPITLTSNLVVWADNTSLTGPISGAGGIEFINDTAAIGGASANGYTGPTTVRCNLLQLNKPAGVQAYGGPLVVGDTGIGGPYEAEWLQPYQHVQGTLTVYANGIVNLNNHNEDFGPVTFNGGEVDTGNGQFAIYQPLTVNASSSTATINGNLGLPGGDARYFNVSDGAADPDLTVNAVMFGSPTYFVKQGAGNMRLANANTFVATTLHEGGTLEVANAAGLGNSGSGCVIFDGATLRLKTGGTVANNFEATGAGTGGTNGAFQVVGANSPTLSGSIQLDANTLFNVASTAGLGLSGSISGNNGALTKSGVGSLTLSGSGANTYGGLTTINSGILFLGKSGGAKAVPGNLVLGPAPAAANAIATFLSPNSIGGNGVTINLNSSMNLNGWSQTLSQLTLNDGGSVATGTGTLYLNGGSTVSCGSLNLLGSSAGSTITGNIGLPPNDFAINFSVGSFSYSTITTAPELDVPANILMTSFEDPSLLPTRVHKSGSGRMRFGGNNTYKGDTYVDGGILQVDGTAAGGVLVDGGTLSGIGTVGPIAMTSSTSVVSPGHSPGILTCSNFNSSTGNGIFKVELNGTNAGTGYSQLAVNGTVNLNNITLQASLNFASSTNDTFTIIANDGLDGIVGTFKGLPGGSQFYIGGQLFTIKYGPGFLKFGNDVVLSRLITPPPPPMLTIQSQPPDSVRLLWPTNSATYTLQSVTNITDTNWSAVAESPVVVGTNNVVTNNATSILQKFYRLSSP